VYEGTEKLVCPEVAVNSVTVLYAVVDTPDAGMPRNLTEMLSVADGGAAEKVSVVPDTEYVLGSCRTPATATMMEEVFAGAADSVNATVEPLPEKVSVRNAAVNGVLPM
jgi:hypothetical protein